MLPLFVKEVQLLYSGVRGRTPFSYLLLFIQAHLGALHSLGVKYRARLLFFQPILQANLFYFLA